MRDMLQAVIVVSAIGSGSAVAQPPVNNDVKSRVLASWTEALGKIDSAQVAFSVDWSRASTTDPLRLHRTDKVRYNIVQNGFRFEYFVKEFEGDKLVEVEGKLEIVNNQYNASMSKKKEEANWSLISYDRSTDADRTDRRQIVLPWTVCGNVDLWEWLSDPRVTVTRTDKVSESVLRVHFDFRATAGKPGTPTDNIFGKGTIDFDEARYHSIVGYRMNRQSKFSEWSEMGEYVYADGERVPLLKKITISIPESRSAKFGTRKSQEVRTFEIEYNTAVPEEIFWLSHYGLPEPLGVTPPRKTSRSVWFIVGAGVFAIFAVVFRTLAKRRANTPPTVTT